MAKMWPSKKLSTCRIFDARNISDERRLLLQRAINLKQRHVVKLTRDSYHVMDPACVDLYPPIASVEENIVSPRVSTFPFLYIF